MLKVFRVEIGKERMRLESRIGVRASPHHIPQQPSTAPCVNSTTTSMIDVVIDSLRSPATVLRDCGTREWMGS
jgi:hypothetical protein